MKNFNKFPSKYISNLFANFGNSQLKALSITGIAIFTLLLAEGCASIGNPSGGPRDERPPRFIKADPAPGSVNVGVDRHRIRIEFDELIDVKDPTTKVIISPPGTEIPRVSAQGHHVDINFRDSLLPNTTYTIDFADAIQDINENNPISNFAYTFSTGTRLDSLRIAGYVLSAREMEPMQLKLVGLHRLPDNDPASTGASTSLPLDFTESIHKDIFTKKFDRVGRTDDRGRFSIEGLAPGRYRIYALDDANSDYKFSNADEEVAFYDLILSPSSATASATDSIFNMKTGQLDTVLTRQRTVFLPNDVLLRSFLSRRKAQYIENYNRIDSTRLTLTFHAAADSMPEFNIIGMPAGAPKPFIAEHSLTNDTITLWLNSKSLIATDTLRLAVKYNVLDSLQRYVAKTDTLRFTTDRNALKKAQNAAKKLLEKQKKRINKDDANREETDTIPKIPLLGLNIPSGSSHEIGAPLRINADAPIARLDTNAFRLETKVDTIWKPFDAPAFSHDTLNPKSIILSAPFQPGKEYRLTVDSLAVKSIYDLHNARLEHTFRVKGEEEYCSLTLRLTDWPAATPGFVELLSADRPVAVAPLENSTAVFLHIQPGKYYARVVHDLNANGKWDSGDPLISLQPEEVYYYPKAINIKKNWNKDESWTVFAIPADTMKPEAILKNRPTMAKNRPNKTASQRPDEEEDE
ncbi:MAG: Ig-like domain-containing protein [Muribaculaceae bacterium]|nr:Ig-like domain-containing protein [Muribaculaceae bacterium]